jgi:putative aldouronate transport system substrate-binding protein
MPDDMAEKFIAQGRALELTPHLEKYGANIRRRLGNYLNLIKTDDGELYKLPMYWGENPNVAGWDFGIRYDWWKESGLPVYTTPDEYYETLKKLMEEHPTNANGEKVYALSDNSQGSALYGAMLAAYGFKNGYKVDENSGEFTHWFNTDEGLEKEISLQLVKNLIS